MIKYERSTSLLIPLIVTEQNCKANNKYSNIHNVDYYNYHVLVVLLSVQIARSLLLLSH